MVIRNGYCLGKNSKPLWGSMISKLYDSLWQDFSLSLLPHVITFCHLVGHVAREGFLALGEDSVLLFRKGPSFPEDSWTYCRWTEPTMPQQGGQGDSCARSIWLYIYTYKAPITMLIITLWNHSNSSFLNQHTPSKKGWMPLCQRCCLPESM